jgi:gas vesicle protein
MSAKGYWISFVIGVSAGATVALLYAPATGVRTRKRIGRSIDQGVNSVTDSLNDAAEYLREQADTLSKQAEATIKRTRGKVEDVVGMASDAVNSVTKRAHALH